MKLMYTLTLDSTGASVSCGRFSKDMRKCRCSCSYKCLYSVLFEERPPPIMKIILAIKKTLVWMILNEIFVRGIKQIL